MSRLSDAVELLSLGATPQHPLLCIGGGIRSIEYGHAWELFARLGTRITLPSTDADALHRARRAMCENLNEYVFGEFRTPLLALRAKLYENGDIENADCVSAILDTMFRS